MKKPLKLLFYLFLAVPVLFAGCQKSEVLDSSTSPKGGNAVKSVIAYTPCGTQMVANLYPAGTGNPVTYNTSLSYGTVTVGNDLVNLYVTYALAPGYYISATNLYIGAPEALLSTSGNVLNPDGTGYFHTGSPPFVHHLAGYPVTLETAYTHVIPLADLPQCSIVVADADIYLSGASYPNYITVYAKAPAFKSYGYYMNYCKQSCSSGGCETAYAKSADPLISNCFIGIPGVTSNNWGWSNGPIGPGTYSWPIYAGAGQCNIANGTLVGTLNVVYGGGTATITYTMGSNCLLNETHLYVGNDILPKKKGKYTTAPGQFPYKHENLNGVSSDTYTITGFSGNIYIAAHSVVCW